MKNILYGLLNIVIYIASIITIILVTTKLDSNYDYSNIKIILIVILITSLLFYNVYR